MAGFKGSEGQLEDDGRKDSHPGSKTSSLGLNRALGVNSWHNWAFLEYGKFGLDLKGRVN